MNTFFTLLYILTAIGFVLWLHNRPNPAQVIHDFKDLTRRIGYEEENLATARRERWGATTEASIQSNLDQLRARLKELEHA